MKEKELIHFLGIPKEEKKDFTALLEEMLEEGLISFSAKEGRHSSLTAKPEEKGYSKASMQKERTLKGVYSKAKMGFGFVSLSEKELDDIYIPKGSEGNTMDGDTVQILVTKEKQGDSSAEGKIVKVMKRAVTEMLGLVKERREGLFLFPDNQKLPSPFYIQPGKAGGALPGDKVMAKILSYGGVQKEERRGRQGRSPIPRGKKSPLLSYPVCGVTEVLGASTEPGVDVLSVIRAFSLPEDFPEEVKIEAESISHSYGSAGVYPEFEGKKRFPCAHDHYHRRRRCQGLGRRHLFGIFSGKEALSSLRAYCRCHGICEGGLFPRFRGSGARNLRVPNGQSNSYASERAFQRHLFPA